jgi:hypothetical protein
MTPWRFYWHCGMQSAGAISSEIPFAKASEKMEESGYA